MSELVLRNLVKAFRTPDNTLQRVVDGVSLTIPSGSFFSLLGPSGCGKTTILRMIAGFERPDGGDVVLGGESLLGLPPYQRPVTTVFQSYALFPHLTVAENVAFGLRRRGDREVEGPVREALALVRMEAKAERLPAKLSGGEKQRVALARALVLRPKLLLLDEPLSALDPKLRAEMRAELRELQRELGITFLFITHDQEEALALSDSLALLQQGRVAQMGEPEEIYLRPVNRFVAEFLGPVNWQGRRGVRPERTRVSREPVGGGARCVAATVRLASFAGDCLQMELRTSGEGGGEFLHAQAPVSSGPFAMGETVYVHWQPEDELEVGE